ncbi:MAG TPA: GtrA family protein [Rhodanobacteraceae bacterium]|jgi:putative flippase GtrA|nr:GtrA family protein [Rhodanobacteraceae bacterium]
MWHLPKQLAWFGVGGFIGFLVDAGVVQLLVSKVDVDPYVGRLFSFLCAATATWLFNRHFTFKRRGDYGLFGEWSRYILAMSAGFAINYLAYALAVHYSEFVRAWPSIGVAIGSIPGSAANFLGARQWVFSGARGRRSAEAGKGRENKP